MDDKIKKILEELSPKEAYKILDKLFVERDKKFIRRTKNIENIPLEPWRRGGKYSYAEWAHVIGIFQTLIYQNVKARQNSILDVGCGTGLLGIAAEPFLGKYVGIDVGKFEIDYCKENFSPEKYDFHHLDASNPGYAPNQSPERVPWNLSDNTFDLVMGLSVWTHFSENDARFYLKEVSRVLRADGRAIITVFALDGLYDTFLSNRLQKGKGRFHGTQQSDWQFTKSAYNSKNWFTPKWTKVPESAIGIKSQGINSMLFESGLKLKEKMPGNWKEIPSVFFQDILILEHL